MKLIVVLCLFLDPIFALPANEYRQVYSIQNRIAGGQPAELGQFPFQVGVQTHFLTRDNEEYTGWCGGSLISDRVVLTAAHCVYRGNWTEIFYGAVDLAKSPSIINVPKQNIIWHEGYGRKFGADDVAVVLLPEKVEFNSNVQPVNLPRKSQRNMDFVWAYGVISGWGRMGDKIGSTEKLQYASRFILPHPYCEHHLSAWYMKETQICVDGSKGISSCRGDSGGPLTVTVEQNGSRTLVGLASYARADGCEKQLPTVYQRVTAYLDWIAEKSGVTLRD